MMTMKNFVNTLILFVAVPEKTWCFSASPSFQRRAQDLRYADEGDLNSREYFSGYAPSDILSSPKSSTGQSLGQRLSRIFFQGRKPTRETHIDRIVDLIDIQGGSLQTWSVSSARMERVKIILNSPDGNPLSADINLWEGPDNAPQRIKVYSEDGRVYPISTMIETPRTDVGNVIAVQNTGQMVFPLTSYVDEADLNEVININPGNLLMRLFRMYVPSDSIQGDGGTISYPVPSSVASTQIVLKNDGRPLIAKIELCQGPYNSKQVIEVYSEDGMERPFLAIIETPGISNVVRVVNKAPMEFGSLRAYVSPYRSDTDEGEPFSLGLQQECLSLGYHHHELAPQ